jgi:hypothetical protein
MRAAKFTEVEDDTIIEEYAQRRHQLEAKWSATVTSASKRSAWEEITNEVNKFSLEERTTDAVIQRYRAIYSEYKSHKSLSKLKGIDVSGNLPREEEPHFMNKMDFADDVRVVGLESGVNLGLSVCIATIKPSSSICCLEARQSTGHCVSKGSNRGNKDDTIEEAQSRRSQREGRRGAR